MNARHPSGRARPRTRGIAAAAAFVAVCGCAAAIAAPGIVEASPGEASVETAVGASVETRDAAPSELLAPLRPQPPGVPWPTEAWPEGPLPEAIDRAELDAAVDHLFESTVRGGLPDTRALVLAQGGRIVFERYAEGFDRTSRFQSWSMAKSITNAFVGLLVGDGLLDLDAPAPVEAWQAPGDPRGEITLRHLLQMRSGLANADGFGEEDMSRSFILRLIAGEGSRAPTAYAANVGLAHPVGTHWAYSTGTSTLVAAIAGEQVGDGRADTLAFLRTRLFDEIGMRSAQPEFAASGEFFGGAYVHANARDWTRFGYLYLRDGVWAGERVLPEDWVDFSRTASPAPNNGIHGAHFWVNREPGPDQWVQLPGAPATAFSAEGAMFQMIAIVPTMDLVAVRLGETQGADFQELRRRFARVVVTFPELESGPVASTGTPRAVQLGGEAD